MVNPELGSDLADVLKQKSVILAKEIVKTANFIRTNRELFGYPEVTEAEELLIMQIVSQVILEAIEGEIPNMHVHLKPYVVAKFEERMTDNKNRQETLKRVINDDALSAEIINDE